MIWTTLRNRRAAHRIGTVDDLQFPASGRQRLGNRHSHLSGDGIRIVEASTRQWFRLVARHPRAKLSMPSVVVDDLWQELTLHARDYAVFCDAAFGRLLHYPPGSAIGAKTGEASRTPLLLATLSHARLDEGCGQTDLPLLFRVDQELGIRDGNRYLADCGGRGECFRVPGVICLQHVGGWGKRPRARGIRGDLLAYDDGYAGGAFRAGGGTGAGEVIGGVGDGGGVGN